MKVIYLPLWQDGLEPPLVLLTVKPEPVHDLVLLFWRYEILNQYIPEINIKSQCVKALPSNKSRNSRQKSTSGAQFNITLSYMQLCPNISVDGAKMR